MPVWVPVSVPMWVLVVGVVPTALPWARTTIGARKWPPSLTQCHPVTEVEVAAGVVVVVVVAGVVVAAAVVWLLVLLVVLAVVVVVVAARECPPVEYPSA